MFLQYYMQLKVPWVGAGAILTLIWILWGMDLHPHFSPIHTPSPLSEGFRGSNSNPIIAPPTSSSAGISQPSKTTKPRPLILYAFFDTELARQNLDFFIRHGLHDAADFLFVMNGETDAEGTLPDRPNVRYVKRKNDCYDMGAFAEVLLKDDLYKKYDRFITMNASIRGPFFPAWSNSCWSDMYLDRITDKVKLVGMTLSCRPLSHVQSMIWAMDRTTLDILLFPSEELVKKFKEELPPHDPNHAVPPMQDPGINSCPHEYFKAVAVEVYSTPLLRSAGYQVDALMSAYHSIPEYETKCLDWRNGDVLSHGYYWGMSLHPFDTIFAKTNRGNDPLTLEKLTEWADLSNYTSYDYCH